MERLRGACRASNGRLVEAATKETWKCTHEKLQVYARAARNKKFCSYITTPFSEEYYARCADIIVSNSVFD